MEVEQIRLFVELVMRQLKGFVPKGGYVHFNLNTYISDPQRVEFDVIQSFDEEDQLPPQIELLKL